MPLRELVQLGGGGIASVVAYQKAVVDRATAREFFAARRDHPSGVVDVTAAVPAESPPAINTSEPGNAGHGLPEVDVTM